MSRIGVWFDGGGIYGFGNIRRSVELGQALRARGHEVTFVPFFPRAAALSPEPASTPSDEQIVLLDVPYTGDEVVRQARSLGAKVLALDFDGTEAPDTVISLQSIRRVPPESRALSGLEYAIIRQEIRTLGTQHEKDETVLVIVGGGDDSGLSQKIVERLGDRPVCVVQGPAGGALDLDRPNVSVVTNPPDLAQRMSRCAWAVTTGGTTMLEMLCLGKAIHVVPRTDAETIFAQRFAEQDALLGLGLDTLRIPTASEIAACEQRGPTLVDGRGCDRIVAEIERLSLS